MKMQDDYSGEAMDLYDDAIVNPLERKHSVDPETGFPSLTPSNNLRNNCFDHKEGISSSRKYQAYIGNLTWVEMYCIFRREEIGKFWEIFHLKFIFY